MPAGPRIGQVQVLGGQVGVERVGPLQHALDAAVDDLFHVRLVDVVVPHQGEHVLDVGQPGQRILGGRLRAGLGGDPRRVVDRLEHHRVGEGGYQGKCQEGKPGTLVHAPSVGHPRPAWTTQLCLHATGKVVQADGHGPVGLGPGQGRQQARVGHEPARGGQQCPGQVRPLGHQHRPALVDHGLGVQELVVPGAAGHGHHERRPAAGLEFRAGAGA